MIKVLTAQLSFTVMTETLFKHLINDKYSHCLYGRVSQMEKIFYSSAHHPEGTTQQTHKFNYISYGNLLVLLLKSYGIKIEDVC